MKSGLLAVLFFFISVYTVTAQEKRTLSHDDYDKWQMISNESFSVGGDHILYNQNPQRGDGNLVFFSLEKDQETHFPRGAKAAFSPGGKFAVFHIEPPRDIVRQARVEKKRPEQMPKDSLGILVLANGDLMTYESVVSYQLPKDGSDWLAFVLNVEREVEETKKEEEITPSDTIPAPQEEEKPNAREKNQKQNN